MCGITLLVERVSSGDSPVSLLDDNRLAAATERLLRQRGPDHYRVLDRSTSNTVDSDTKTTPANEWRIRFASAVLHLRGDALTPQPMVDAHGNVLCWNGEVFGFDGMVMDAGNDTQWLSEQLFLASSSFAGDCDCDQETTKQQHHQSSCDAKVLSVLQRIHGPFAFVWFHAATKRLYFGHDRFGRRSLLIHTASNDSDAEEQAQAQEEEQEQPPVDLVSSLAAAAASSSTASASTSIGGLTRLVLSSVALPLDEPEAAAKHRFDEVPSTGIYVLNLPTQSLHFQLFQPLFPSPSSSPSSSSPSDILPVQDLYSCGLPVSCFASSSSCSPLERAARGLLTSLSNAVGVRVRTIPRPPSSSNTSTGSITSFPQTAHVGVLFSGGLDSVVLAALTHFHVQDPCEPIDLINVCFDTETNFQSPDRLAAKKSFLELKTLFPSRKWHFVAVNVNYATQVVSHKQEIMKLINPCDTQMDWNIGTAFWFLARGQGDKINGFLETENNENDDLNGFLTLHQDAASSQRIAEEEIQALGLFQVDGAKAVAAAEEPKTNVPLWCQAAKCKRKQKPGCPLRVCRVCCLKMQKLVETILMVACPGTTTSDDEQTNERATFVARKQLAGMLDPPLKTEEDKEMLVDKLLAVWQRHWPTAAEATVCRVHRRAVAPTKEEDVPPSSAMAPADSNSGSTPYKTSARVLLVGIGADEQLGGYGRHKTAFHANGESGLRHELARDMARIWKRNLGRDDRCISSHGKEARFPFLDEQVVSFIASLPLHCVCDFEKERGEGDKQVLRVAARMLGLHSCAALAKRAIQFGTRIAKHSNAASFGSNRRASGKAKISPSAKAEQQEQEEEEELEGGV